MTSPIRTKIAACTMALAAGSASIVATAAPAISQEAHCSISISPTAPQVGDILTTTATGFFPGETVNVTTTHNGGSNSFTVTANSSGTLSGSGTISAADVGNWTTSMVGTESQGTCSLSFTVSAAPDTTVTTEQTTTTTEQATTTTVERGLTYTPRFTG